MDVKTREHLKAELKRQAAEIAERVEHLFPDPSGAVFYAANPREAATRFGEFSRDCR